MNLTHESPQWSSCGWLIEMRLTAVLSKPGSSVDSVLSVTKLTRIFQGLRVREKNSPAFLCYVPSVKSFRLFEIYL